MIAIASQILVIPRGWFEDTFGWYAAHRRQIIPGDPTLKLRFPDGSQVRMHHVLIQHEVQPSIVVVNSAEPQFIEAEVETSFRLRGVAELKADKSNEECNKNPSLLCCNSGHERCFRRLELP